MFKEARDCVFAVFCCLDVIINYTLDTVSDLPGKQDILWNMTRIRNVGVKVMLKKDVCRTKP
jgi:hypothetical protein